MKRVLFSGVLTLAFLAGLLYCSPYLAMHHICSATLEEDTATLAAHVDQRQLRASLNLQLQSLFSAPGVASDVKPDVIEPLVDTMLLPEGMIALVKLNDRYEKPLSKVSDISGRQRNTRPDYVLHYMSWNSVVAQRAHSKSHIGELTLTRDGLWGWKLTSVALPRSLLTDA